MNTEIEPQVNPVICDTENRKTISKWNETGLPDQYFTIDGDTIRLSSKVARKISWSIVSRRRDSATIRPAESTIEINGVKHTINKQQLLCTVDAAHIGYEKSPRLIE